MFNDELDVVVIEFVDFSFRVQSKLLLFDLIRLLEQPVDVQRSDRFVRTGRET